jgi:hypothetical protein
VTAGTADTRDRGATMSAMRWVSGLLAVATMIGCSDPSLRVEVIPAPGFDPVTITVYVFQSDTLLCDDVEYGVATEDTLQTLLVASATIGTGETLDGVSRVEPKVIVALGVDANGSRVFAGCEQRGEITGDDVVTIETHAVARVTITGDALDKPFARRDIKVAAVDALGRPLDARSVRWRSDGVAGAFAPDEFAESSPNVCTERGVATIEPADPDLPGPIAALVRVSWADATPAPLSGFVENVTNQVDLREPGALARKPPACAVRRERDGADTVDHVYCLKRPPEAETERQLVELDIAGNALALTPVGAPIAGDHLVATDMDADGSDELYVVQKIANAIRWTGVAGTADGATFVPCNVVTGACTFASIRRIVIVPSCGGAPGFAVLSFATAIDERDELVFTDLRGAPLPVQPTSFGNVSIDLLAGGCVAEATSDGVPHQGVVARLAPIAGGGNTFNHLVAVCDGEPCTARWPGFGAVGFSSGARPRLLSSEVDITGNVVVESEIFVAGDGDLALMEVARTPTTAPARAIASADVDGDGTEDLAWSQFLTDDTGATANRIQLAVGREGLPFPGRLTGLSPALPGSQALVLFARLDGDASPDLVTFSDEQASVYRSGVEVPHEAPAGDETHCP